MSLERAPLILLWMFFFSFSLAFAASSDPRLIALIPPSSQIVAGMLGPSSAAHPRSLLLVTEKNRIDLDDFYALTGADASRSILNFIFMAANGRDGMLREHSLFVEGHFSADAISRSAVSDGAETQRYRGVAVLVIPPLARERSTFDEVRWLAVLESRVVIFGSVASVREELDRYLAKSPADWFLVQRLNRLGHEDQAWCLFPEPSPNSIIPKLLDQLDPKLGAIARAGGSMQYGIHFGRQVEVIASSNGIEQATENGQLAESLESTTSVSYLLPRSDERRSMETESARVKVPQRQYEAWIIKFSNASLREMTVAPSR